MATQKKPEFDIGVCSHVGLRRNINEDDYCIDQTLGLFLIADGMGGHIDGDLASRTATRVFRETLYKYSAIHHNSNNIDNLTDSVTAAVTAANATIYELNQSRGFSDGRGMGTALSGLFISNDGTKGIVFHIGDCRVYRYRDARLERLTKDHSLYQKWKDAEIEGPAPNRNIILRVVGPGPQVEAEMKTVDLQSGDMFLLCSDGLTDMLTDQEILNIMKRGPLPQINMQCEHFVAEANNQGGLDNITVMLVGTTLV